MTDDTTCAVCGESVNDSALLAECRACGALFHLNPRADIEGIDCGDVWTGDAEAPALQFHCQPCIDRLRGGGQVAPTEAPSTPPGMPSLPPGAPPEMLAAMAGWPTPPDPGAPPAEAAADSPPPLRPRPQRRRRFRRIDTD